jgi:hypothetical protein
MSCVHQEQCRYELWKYLTKVTMRPNEAAAKAGNLTRLVAWPCDPSAS